MATAKLVMEFDMVKSGFKVIGTLKIAAKRAGGVEETLTVRNTVVNWGLVSLASVIAGTQMPTTLTHIALGDSSTPVQLGDTALGNELNRDLADVQQLAPPSDTTVQFQTSYGIGTITGTFREAGIFDASSAGNMFNRVVFDDFIVGTADELTVTWIIEIRNG